MIGYAAAVGLGVAVAGVGVAMVAKRWAARAVAFEDHSRSAGAERVLRVVAVVVPIGAGGLVAGACVWLTWIETAGVAFFALVGTFIVVSDLAARVVPVVAAPSLVWTGLLFSPVASLFERVLAGALLWGLFELLSRLSVLRIGARMRGERPDPREPAIGGGDVFVVSALGAWLGLGIGIGAALAAVIGALAVGWRFGEPDPRIGGARVVAFVPYLVVAGWFGFAWAVAGPAFGPIFG